MSFSIKLGPQPDKLIRKLDSQIIERIKNRLLKLQEDPFPQEVERVEGYKGEKLFRIRVGDYRILYIVRYESNIIIVSRIDKRRKSLQSIIANYLNKTKQRFLKKSVIN